DGNDPMSSKIQDAQKGDTVDVSAQGLQSDGFLGGGSCFADRSFQAMGHTVTMSFGEICDKIAPLRAVVLLCAFITAYILVSKSVLQG
ncbi:MAG: hypothetical protein NWQ13_03835, partial [Glaciimonas sp.]|nr:hypothetical protein [Glaciimonas sp.]